MGLIDSMSSAANRGVAAAGRTSRTVKLKMQADDLLKQRKELAAQLGAGLYEKTREMPEMREGCESLYEGIAEIDRRRQEINEEIAALEMQAQQNEKAAKTLQCSRCGNTVLASDVFCSGCGRPVSEIRREAEEAEKAAARSEPNMAGDPQGSCPACGKPVASDDVYCMYCGVELSTARTEADSPVDQPVPSESARAERAEPAGEGALQAEGASSVGESALQAEGALPAEEGALCEDALESRAAGESELGLSAAPAGPQERPEVGASFCVHCGGQVASDDLFCSACGERIVR